MNNGAKAVFLDRDGTINVEKNYMFKTEEFEYNEGALKALRRLNDAGYLLVVITNQSGIARGYYTEQDYYKVDNWMKKDLLSRGIMISASYYCPHHPEAIVSRYRCKCKCRKPGTELFHKAQEELNIDMDLSFAIGDRMRDLAICYESGVKGILLSGNESKMLDGVFACPSWNDAVSYILGKNER